MADNTTLNAGTGGDVIATDDLATLNGGATSGCKVQRVKVGYGSDSILRDVDATYPLPGFTPGSVVTGTITAANANHNSQTGAPTANSYVELDLDGRSAALTVAVTGTFNATVQLQLSLDGTNWFVVAQSATWYTLTGNYATSSINSTGLWRSASIGGCKRARISCSSYTSGTMALAVIASATTASMMMFQGSGDIIGQVGISSSQNAIIPSSGFSQYTITSSTKTASGTSGGMSRAGGVGALFYLNVTAVSGTSPTMALKIQAFDTINSLAYDLPGCAFPTITATGQYLLMIRPGISEVANSKVSGSVPSNIQLAWTIGGTSPSFTFSVMRADLV